MRAGFVTFEGIDGAGKTTVSRLVLQILRSRGIPAVLTAEPTSGWTGDAVRRSYADDVGPVAESFLFLADRATHLPEIRAHLEAGRVVLCDRYADSTYAYQGVRLAGVVRDPMGFLERVSAPWLLPPDLTVLVRIDPEEGLRRIQDRAGKVRFEDLAFLRRVSKNYAVLARRKGFVVLDGRDPPPEVAARAVAAIEKALTRSTRRGPRARGGTGRGTRARRP